MKLNIGPRAETNTPFPKHFLFILKNRTFFTVDGSAHESPVVLAVVRGSGPRAPAAVGDEAQGR